MNKKLIFQTSMQSNTLPTVIKLFQDHNITGWTCELIERDIIQQAVMSHVDTDYKLLRALEVAEQHGHDEALYIEGEQVYSIDLTCERDEVNMTYCGTLDEIASDQVNNELACLKMDGKYYRNLLLPKGNT